MTDAIPLAAIRIDRFASQIRQDISNIVHNVEILGAARGGRPDAQVLNGPLAALWKMRPVLQCSIAMLEQATLQSSFEIRALDQAREILEDLDRGINLLRKAGAADPDPRSAP